MPGLHEPARHVRTHIAETDEADVHILAPTNLCRHARPLPFEERRRFARLCAGHPEKSETPHRRIEIGPDKAGYDEL
jgi:hypothetical protein